MCGLLGGCFDVLASYLYFGGYFEGRLETCPPCIMDYYVLGAFREMRPKLVSYI
jgi:hypothetical protein